MVRECKVQSRISALGLIFWTISETPFHQKSAHPPQNVLIYALSFKSFNLSRLLESCYGLIILHRGGKSRPGSGLKESVQNKLYLKQNLV